MNTSSVVKKVTDVDVEKLSRSSKAYKEAVDAIARAIHELTGILDELEVKHFTHGRLTFSADTMVSNIGNYGSAFSYLSGNDEFAIDRVIEVGTYYKSYYLHNDFNATIATASRADVIKAAKEMPAFINSLIAFYESGTEKANEALPLLKRMAGVK